MKPLRLNKYLMFEDIQFMGSVGVSLHDSSWTRPNREHTWQHNPIP